MKKVLVLAAAALIGTSAYAQDVFKQISKIKDYKEAANLLKSNLGSMSDEEKAKCYNALVDLSCNKVTKEQATISESEANKLLKKDPVPHDTLGLFDAAYNAVMDGEACDGFDNKPNLKGKIKPKFHNPNAERLYPMRNHLINAVVHYQNKGDDAIIRKFLDAYVESNDFALFKDVDKSKDANLGQMAYFAGLYACRANDYTKAEKFLDIAMNDSAFAKDAFNLKLTAMQSQLKTHADSLNYVNKLKDLYAKDSKNDVVFQSLCSMLLNVNDTEGLNAIVKEKLAQDPGNITALLMQGQADFNDRKYDDAIAKFTTALEKQPKNIAVIGMVGQSYMLKAQDAANRAAGKNGRIAPAAEKQIIEVYEKAIEYFEKAKDLDFKNEYKNYWAYQLYNCVYRIKGADDPKTQQYKSLIE